MIQVLMDKIRLAGWVTSIAVIHGKFIRMLPYSQLQMKIYRDPRIQKSGKPPGGRVFNGWRSTLRHFTTSTGAGARCKDLLQHGESRCQRALTAVPTRLAGSWFNRRTLVAVAINFKKSASLAPPTLTGLSKPRRKPLALTCPPDRLSRLSWSACTYKSYAILQRVPQRFCHVLHFNHPFPGSRRRSLHLKITAKTYLCNIKYLCHYVIKYLYNIFVSDPLSPLFAMSTRKKIRRTHPAQYHYHLPKSNIAGSLEILAHWSNVSIKNMRSVFSLWINLSRRSPAILWWRVAVARSRLKIARKHINTPTHTADLLMSSCHEEIWRAGFLKLSKVLTCFDVIEPHHWITWGWGHASCSSLPSLPWYTKRYP